jgi:threonine synthase
VQAKGCTPLMHASKAEWMKRKPGLLQEVHTQAAGLRVPSAIGDRLILQAAHESGGTALAVSDDEMR